MSLKIAWLAPYPVVQLTPLLQIARKVKEYHPCSWIVNLSNALAQRNEIELHLITESHLVTKAQVIQFNNISFHVLKSGIPFLNRGFPPQLPFEALTGFRLNIRRIISEIKRINPQIVHAFGTEYSYSLAGIYSQYPCLISMQGIIQEIVKVEPSLRYRLISKFEKRAVNKNPYFTGRTNFDIKFILENNPSARIFEIYEAMNPIFFQNTWELKNEPSILYVGTLHKRKGIEVLLEALTIIVKEIPDIHLTVVGGGNKNYLAFLKTFCHQHKIAKHVSFKGFESAEKIAYYHKTTQIFVLPTEMDNSPNTLAEAMVSGVPVIASNVGGIPSMIEDGENGILIPPNKPEQLAEKIIYLLKSPEIRKKLSMQAKNKARNHHNPAYVAEKTICAYKEIIMREINSKNI